jgi:hypothetical protein
MLIIKYNFHNNINVYELYVPNYIVIDFIDGSTPYEIE